MDGMAMFEARLAEYCTAARRLAVLSNETDFRDHTTMPKLLDAAIALDIASKGVREGLDNVVHIAMSRRSNAERVERARTAADGAELLRQAFKTN